MTTRSDIVNTARDYLGTPFHHAGRLPGVGMDCVGLPICIMRELGMIAADFDVPNYVVVPDGKTMLKLCREYLWPIQQIDTRVGDLVVFATDVYPQHVGIIGNYQHGGFSIIHAANNASPPRVIETRLMFSRRMRFVAAFMFPGIA